MRDAIRAHIVTLLGWEEAHVDFETAVAGIPAALQGRRVEGCAHSAYHLGQLVAVRQQLGAWKR